MRKKASIKLTPAQKRMIHRMREGYNIWKGNFGYYFVYWNTGKLPFNEPEANSKVLYFLESKNLVMRGWDSTYELTDLGKTINID